MNRDTVNAMLIQCCYTVHLIYAVYMLVSSIMISYHVYSDKWSHFITFAVPENAPQKEIVNRGEITSLHRFACVVVLLCRSLALALHRPQRRRRQGQHEHPAPRQPLRDSAS